MKSDEEDNVLLLTAVCVCVCWVFFDQLQQPQAHFDISTAESMYVSLKKPNKHSHILHINLNYCSISSMPVATSLTIFMKVDYYSISN